MTSPDLDALARRIAKKRDENGDLLTRPALSLEIAVALRDTDAAARNQMDRLLAVAEAAEAPAAATEIETVTMLIPVDRAWFEKLMRAVRAIQSSEEKSDG